MKRAGLERLRRVIALAKLTEMARVTANRAAANAARTEAAAPRAAAKSAMPADSLVGMQLLGEWQRIQESKARDKEAFARALDSEMPELRAHLARATGREGALDILTERARRETARIAERRAETPPSAQSPYSSTSPSSDGTA